MTLLLLLGAIVVAWLTVIGVALLILHLRVILVPDSPLTSVAKRLLIVAPHPADSVVIGAGQAMRTLEHHGAVRVICLTDGTADTEPTTRPEREARTAWLEVDLEPDALLFLGYRGHHGLTAAAPIRAAIPRLRDEINRFAPDRVVVPTYEGGHFQHDVANLITVQALAASPIKTELYEALVYNFYYSWRATPRKLISLLTRLMPGAGVDFPTEAINQRSIYVQPMRDSELATKRRMLEHFHSSHPEAGYWRGGDPDRFQRHRPHDYRRPPFDYRRSLVGRLANLAARPVLGRLFDPLLRRLFPMTHTVHPDPTCRMTQLPAELLDELGVTG